MKLRLTFLAFLIATACYGQISMERQDEGILIKDGDSDVLFYQIEPKSINGKYLRNNYIHPLWGINGNVLTEDFPEGHLHHRGIFWAWHQIWINGKRIGDGWELKDFIQDISEVEFLVNKKGQGVLNTKVYWHSPLWASGKGPYIREDASIVVHPKQGKKRRIDFEIQLFALEDGLSIGGSEDSKGYGGFSARIILPEDILFSGEDGNVQPETNAVDAGPYINISGAFGKNGGKGGIALLENPENPGYPNPWILREKGSMQNVAWPGREPVRISTSEPIVLKYSMVVYKGKLKDKKIRKIVSNKM